MMVDVNMELCLVSAPHQRLDTLGNDTPEDPWDYLTVDRNGKLVRHFCILPALAAPTAAADLCKGRAMTDVFPKGITDVFAPLVDVAMHGLTGQLHTIYKAQSLTLFVFPLMNDVNSVIAATIIYRPTKYNQVDIAKLISGTAHVSAGPVAPMVATHTQAAAGATWSAPAGKTANGRAATGTGSAPLPSPGATSSQQP